MSSAPVEPIRAMLARWWDAKRAGAPDDAVIIIALWRAEVIAAAAAKRTQL